MIWRGGKRLAFPSTAVALNVRHDPFGAHCRSARSPSRRASDWSRAIRQPQPGAREAGTAAEDWPWSSVKAHLAGSDDGLVSVKLVLDRVGDFATFLLPDPRDEAAFSAIRLSEGSGRPLANAPFVADLERLLL